MTIDERLDRLAERHEAMAQTLELMIHQQRDWQEQDEGRWKQNEEWLRKNQVLMAEATENIHTLARIAQSHERRIADLERPQN